jgi:hypothetical protein
MGKQKWKVGLAVVFGIGVVATATVLAYGYYLHREARSVLDDVYALTSASDRDAAFAALRQKYGNRLIPDDGCTANSCSYHTTVSNHPISALFRIPYTELNARFDLRGKSVVLVMVDYRSAQSNRASPVVHVQIDFCIGRCGNFDYFYLHPWSQSSTPERWNGIVEMGFATTPELRQAALSFNTDCLTKIGGCTDIAQLLPPIWKPLETGVRCVVQNREGQAR